MSNRSTSSAGPPGIPPPQQSAQAAQRKAVESLRGQSEEQLRWLGADPCGRHWRLSVMDRVLLVDLQSGEICLEDHGHVRPTWQILALHYLDVRSRPSARPTEITFASLRSARVYASVYENRVNRRLCATVGNDGGPLQLAANSMRARPVEGGDLAFDIDLFPRIPLRLIWYAGDEELPPSCTLLLPANIESYLPTEDIVVLSEALVSRLAEWITGHSSRKPTD